MAPMTKAVHIGVFLGQRQNQSAICVADMEYREESKNRFFMHYFVRFLERLPSGKSYPQVAHRVGEIYAGINSRGKWPFVYLDVTGLGSPIGEVMETEGRLEAVTLVYFSHGDQRTEDRESSFFRVRLGKAFLVTRLQSLLQTGRLHLPRSAEAEALAQELLAFELDVSKVVLDLPGSFPVGSRDDLVTALGLAVQVEPYTCGIG